MSSQSKHVFIHYNINGYFMKQPARKPLLLFKIIVAVNHTHTSYSVNG